MHTSGNVNGAKSDFASCFFSDVPLGSSWSLAVLFEHHSTEIDSELRLFCIPMHVGYREISDTEHIVFGLRSFWLLHVKVGYGKSK